MSFWICWLAHGWCQQHLRACAHYWGQALCGLLGGSPGELQAVFASRHSPTPTVSWKAENCALSPPDPEQFSGRPLLMHWLPFATVAADWSTGEKAAAPALVTWPSDCCPAVYHPPVYCLPQGVL